MKQKIDKIIDLVNISLSNCIESNKDAERYIRELSSEKKIIERLSMFIKEASGEDYSYYIETISQ